MSSSIIRDSALVRGRPVLQGFEPSAVSSPAPARAFMGTIAQRGALVRLGSVMVAR
jgi:hypothetical protein